MPDLELFGRRDPNYTWGRRLKGIALSRRQVVKDKLTLFSTGASGLLAKPPASPTLPTNAHHELIDKTCGMGDNKKLEAL